MSGQFIRTNRILEILEARGIKKDLSRFTYALKKIGNPHKKFTSILVGGTNGKGSVVFTVSEILKKNGYKTGSYISPHIFDVRERIMLNLKKIPFSRFNTLFDELFKFYENKNIKLTYFEFLTAAAFRYFYEEKIDIGVVEVGVGGRWDATNVLNPVVSVITTVQLDHTNILGNTIEKIAKEKSGILRKFGVSIFGEVPDNLIKIAENLKNTFFRLHNDFFYKINKKIKIHCLLDSYEFNRTNPDVAFAKNIALSCAVCDVLKLLGYKLKTYSLSKIPGRFQIYKLKGRKIIFDVAHNTDAIKNIVSAVKGKKLTIVFSCMKDKDYRSMIEALKTTGNPIYFVQLPYERGLKYESVKNYNIKQMKIENILKIKGDILITGSHYIIGEVIEKLKLYDAAY